MIVGEVDFFVLEAEMLSRFCKPPTEESDNTWQHPRTYRATYFGSDFNYATQLDFR